MESLIFQASLNAISYNKSIIIEFQKIVSPLLVNFPVSYLMYLRFFKNGHYLVLCNNIRPIELYLGHNLLNEKVFLQEFTFIEKNSINKYLWPLHNCHKSSGLSMLSENNMWHGINVNYNTDNYLETFVFFTQKENEQVIDLYLNHFYILERFIVYFRNKAQHLINCSNKKAFAFSPFYKKEINNLATQETPLFYAKNNFFNSTIIHKIYLNHGNTYIPYQASKCLYYYTLGKSMKEIACILSISHRTVERHLQNIKTKFNLNYYQQLVDLSKQYNIDKLHLEHFKN